MYWCVEAHRCPTSASYNRSQSSPESRSFIDSDPSSDPSGFESPCFIKTNVNEADIDEHVKQFINTYKSKAQCQFNKSTPWPEVWTILKQHFGIQYTSVTGTRTLEMSLGDSWVYYLPTLGEKISKNNYKKWKMGVHYFSEAGLQEFVKECFSWTGHRNHRIKRKREDTGKRTVVSATNHKRSRRQASTKTKITNKKKRGARERNTFSGKTKSMRHKKHQIRKHLFPEKNKFGRDASSQKPEIQNKENAFDRSLNGKRFSYLV